MLQSEFCDVFSHFESCSDHSRCAPFVYDAWKHPQTLAIVSEIAGVDLVPVMDYEIGHINTSVQSEEDKAKFLAAVADKKSQKADNSVSDGTWEDKDPIVDWHTDGYHFVCVVMLSDCKDMIGGETELRKGNGETIKIRGPQMVSPVFHEGYKTSLTRSVRVRQQSSRDGTSNIEPSLPWE